MVQTQFRYEGQLFLQRTAGVQGSRTLPRVARGVVAALVVGALWGLSGCATDSMSNRKDASEMAATVEPMAEYLGRAQAVEADEGGRERARQIYRDAAKAHPTDKRPWLRLAQSYFDAADYGNAVLAAQEVVQRDATDNIAQGLLAVSGLRVSTAALSALRAQNNLNSSTRSEAEAMATNLRSVLGESVLVPKAAPRARQKPRAVSNPVSELKPGVAPAPTRGAVAPSNPFGALK